MKKRLLRVTPFLIICVMAVIGLIYFLVAERNSANEVRFAFGGMMLLMLIILVVVDIALWKMITKKYWLWLIEIVLLLATAYWWIVSE